MTWPQLRSLRTRALVLGVVPATLLVVALGGYFSVSRINDLELAFEQRASALARQIAAASVYPVFSGNQPALAQVVDSIAGDPEITGLVIEDATGHALADYQRSAGDAPSQVFRAPIRSEPVAVDDFETAAHGGGALLGQIQLVVSRQTLLARNGEVLRLGALLSALGILAAVAMARFMAGRISGPVQALTEAARTIEQGAPMPQLPSLRDEEFATLGNAMQLMDREIRRAREQLEHDIARATAELAETLEAVEIKNVELDLARRRAQEAYAVKSRFLANISHELRTPLHTIHGFSERLADGALDDAQRRQLQFIEHASADLGQILDDMLDVAALESGELRLELAPFDLIDELEYCISVNAPKAHAKQLELLLRVFDDVPRAVLGDAARIRRVALILLDNAIKFTTAGEVALQVSLDGRDAAHAVVEIEVSDTGPGIPARQQTELFALFGQGDTALNRASEGLGLGLAIADRLVRRMGGQISFDSHSGHGSAFRFTCPLKTRPDQGTDSVPESPGARVLVCDTHPRSLHITRHLLRAQGYEVDTCDRPETLCDRATTARPALIVIGLRGTDTPDAPWRHRLEQMRAAEVPTLALLSSSRLSDHAAWEECGATRCVGRPLPRALLHLEVERLVAAGRHERRTGPLEGRSALVVDDNAINRDWLTLILERAGMRVDSAADGVHALAAAGRRRYDVIVLDLHMPRLDGIAAAQRLREQIELPNAATPLIAVTADTNSATERSAREAGIGRVLAKPIDEATLLNAVRQAMLPVGSIGLPRDRQAQISLFGGDATLADQMYARFIGQLREACEGLAETPRGTHGERAALVHRLLGAAVYCGVTPLITAGRAWHASLLRGEDDEAGQARFLAEAERLLNADRSRADSGD